MKKTNEKSKCSRSGKKIKTNCFCYSKQPCWTCKKYINGCSWSRSFKPVEGWEAEEVLRTYTTGTGENRKIETIKSYKIIKCPEYDPD